MISAIVITKNEENMLADCLDSLDWVDEIVVIDTGSTDNTVEIAKRYKAKVINFTSGKSFSDWRNKGLTVAKGEWVLYVDADERVTPLLEKEIQSLVTADAQLPDVAYAIPRENIILGKKLVHGGWWPDYVKRLYLKKNLKGWSGELHEEPQFNGKLGHLKYTLIHIKHENFAEMVDKTNNWSEIEAKLMYEAHHPKMNIPRFLTAMGREFWYRMIKKQAYLDGRIGVMFAMYQVFSRFVSYAKLWELQETKH